MAAKLCWLIGSSNQAYCREGKLGDTLTMLLNRFLANIEITSTKIKTTSARFQKVPSPGDPSREPWHPSYVGTFPPKYQQKSLYFQVENAVLSAMLERGFYRSACHYVVLVVVVVVVGVVVVICGHRYGIIEWWL